MTIFNGMNITASALTSQRLRMDVISSNLANADSTRATQVNGEWQPYRRKMVQLQSVENPFRTYLDREMNGSQKSLAGNGVRVSRIVDDPTPFKVVYDPSHPDADGEGYVQLPNVDPLKEMIDLMSATRSYEANVTAFNATKSMLMKALEIGK